MKFSPESIDLSLCESNVYNDAESVVKSGMAAAFHFHGQDGSINDVTMAEVPGT